MPDNYTITYMNMPFKIFGFTLYDGNDDYYTIFVNARHSFYEQQKTLKHELNHIIQGDLKSNVNINEIEFCR